MKRKLALLLAGVMTATMLPMNLFASSTNGLERTIPSAEDNTVIVQPGYSSNSAFGSYYPDGGANDNIDAWMVGNDFTIKLNTAVQVGETIDLSLDNATWMYQSRLTVASAPAAYTGISAATVDQQLVDAFGVASKPVYAPATGRWINGASAPDYANGAVLATINQDSATGGYMAATSSNVFQNAYVKTSGDSIQYVMGFSDFDDSLATLKFDEALPKDFIVRIPMAILVDDSEKDVALTIAGNNTSVSTGKYTILSSVSGGTVTTVSEVATGRDFVSLGSIIIKELKLNSLSDLKNTRGFTLTLQDGYEFVSVGAVNVAPYELTVGNDSGFVASYDDDELTITVSGNSFIHTSNLASLYIPGLRVDVPDTVSNEDIVMTIEDLGGSKGVGITTQTLTVGKYVDYGAALVKSNSSDKIPELVAGRAPATNASANKLVKFKLSENITGSLFNTRGTKLVFPEDITVMQVTPTAGNGSTSVGSASVVYDGNVATVKGLTSTGKISANFEVWVSIPVSFGGNDITVAVENAGVTVEPLVVATTVAPISVQTTVTTIKVGAVAQAVSNIKITENVAGALQKDKEVRLIITDAYGSTDDKNLIIASGAKATVTEGDIDVELTNSTKVSASSLIATNSNELVLKIDRTSRKASTIELSNVHVKANTNLPETKGIPYKVYVYGTAVAANYGSNDYFSKLGAQEIRGNYKDLIDSGFFVDYIEVKGTTVAGAADIPTKEFILVAGATSALVDGNAVEFTADMAAYLDPAGTVMISTRLVAEAFGLVPLWDDATKSVTIVDLAGNPVVMFPVGKTYYVKGGMNVPMVNNGVQVTSVNKEGRTFVSLRQMANALGLGDKVAWDDATKTVTLNKKGE